MGWLLSRDDVRFFEDHPRIAARFRRNRFHIFLSYWRDLHAEIAAFHRESLRLVAHGAWDLLAHLARKRAVLLYHEARLLQAALRYRWMPAVPDVSQAVSGSLQAILAEVALPVTA